MSEKDPWEWLSLVDVDGPFLSKAALKSFYKQGLPRADASVDDVNATFVEEHTRWMKASATADVEAYREARDRWVTVVLRDLLQWGDELNFSPAASLVTHSPNSTVTVAPWATLERDATPLTLVTVVDRTPNMRATGTDGWSANAIDRMANLLRETGVTIGIVTDGRWWALVSAAKDVTTASGVFDAQLWREERPGRDAFFALAGFGSIAGGQPEQRLDMLFAESVASAEQITEALGDQVSRAVELVLQSFSEVHLRALAEHGESPLPDDPKQVYEGAVTVLMRVVFLLFAEQRGLLPDHELYRSAYAISEIRQRLANDAQRTSVETLDHTWETWHRLLAASNAVYNGTSFEDMRMPAYGGSLFDPARFPWLETTDAQGGLQVRVSDRVMLEVLSAVQIAVVSGDARLLSFRDLDVEQIGYVYEGLLGYSAEYTSELIVGLQGKKAGFEPEVPLAELETIADLSSTPDDFGKRLNEHLSKTQARAKPKTANQIAKAYLAVGPQAEADARTKLRHTLLGDDEAVERLLPFAGLIREDLREFPYVVPAGGIVMAESPQRANTGTHYTPRSLAEEVVLHALEPLVYSPGPFETEDDTQWKLKSSTEILNLKVADIAAGSGAFLVAAARFLAARLVEARALEGLDVAKEPNLERWAIREVVARCLYGADINGMAVEMCKLSLWLISMDSGKPFSFVDDRVFHGNSLLGVTTEAQLKAQHIYPERREAKTPLRWFDVDADLEKAAKLRRELASGQVDDADRMRSTRAKRALLEESKRVTAKLRDAADGIIAAGLLEGGKPGKKLDERYDALADALRGAYPDGDMKPDRRQLDVIIATGLTPNVDTGEARWKPLHWILEAPDVIHDHGGFDAIIGNPPFLGGQKLTGAMGKFVRDWIVNVLATGRPGSADLVAYFFLRSQSLLRFDGVFGLLATNTIAQGATRVVGLEQLLESGVQIVRAVPGRPWPSSNANLIFSAVWATSAAISAPRSADGIATAWISAMLEPGEALYAAPARLAENHGLVFQGCVVLGMGFIIGEALAAAWIQEDSRFDEILFPYLNSEDLNSRPDTTASRWVIDFFGKTASEAASYGAAYERVLALIKPERDANNRKSRREKWWLFAENSIGLRHGVAGMHEVLTVGLVSKYMVPVRVAASQVFSHKLAVFVNDSYANQAVLSSSIYWLWAVKYSSTLGSGVNFSPSDAFDTFPAPTLTGSIESLGVQLDSARREIMLRRQLSLTGLYNLVNSRDLRGDPDIDVIRSIHLQIDAAVMEAYGWTDIPLKHGFHTYRQMERWTVSPTARVEILDRLLEKNHCRAAAEAAAGLTKGKKGKSLEESEKPEGAMF